VSHFAIDQDLGELRHTCREAGMSQAMQDLGMSKEAAIWGALGSLGSKLWGATGGKAVGWAAKPFEWMGQKALGAVGQASPGAANWLGRVGAGAGREMAGFGLLTGGLNAATAEPGERGQAFARGFAGGALGGLGWRAGGNLTRMGMQRGLGAARMGAIESAAKPGMWESFRQGGMGQGFRTMGAKALTAGVPFAGAMGLSMAAPTFETQQQQQQRPPGVPYAPNLMYAGGKALTGQGPY